MSLTNVDTHTVTMWKLSGSRTSCFHSILFAFFLSCFAEEDLTGEEEEMPSFRGEGHMHTSLTTTNIEYTNGLCINVWIWLLFSVCVCVCVALLCYVKLHISTISTIPFSLLYYNSGSHLIYNAYDNILLTEATSFKYNRAKTKIGYIIWQYSFF